MHELAIAETILARVEQWVRENGYGRVTAVGMRIGKLSSVVPDALSFGFEVLARDTAFESACLEIEHVPVRGRCRGCLHEFEIEIRWFVCPRCESREVDMLQGDELEIAYLRVEDEGPG